MLQIGTKAPDFTLFDKEGNAVSLSDFLGKRVVLYFYPKDNTRVAPVKPARLRGHTKSLKRVTLLSSVSVAIALHPIKNLPKSTSCRSFCSLTLTA